MIIDIFGAEEVQHDHVGGKGYNLHKLHKAGLPVPRAIVVRSDIPDVDELGAKLKGIEWINESYSLAVRSSGIGEDSLDRSWAGIFESYLFVEPYAVVQHILKVVHSRESIRYEKYSVENGVEVNNMAVIVQEMIDADYAGVAFTASPIENDDRITLIEVVKGVGEALVSNQKTPTTLRVNKITGMTRIQQTGDDNIKEATLSQLCDLLMPYLESIEALYGRPMDVEWAAKDGRVFILQARPVTTL